MVLKEFNSNEEAEQYAENWISRYNDNINSNAPKKGTKFMIPSYLVDRGDDEIDSYLKSRIVD